MTERVARYNPSAWTASSLTKHKCEQPPTWMSRPDDNWLPACDRCKMRKIHNLYESACIGGSHDINNKIACIIMQSVASGRGGVGGSTNGSPWTGWMRHMRQFTRRVLGIFLRSRHFLDESQHRLAVYISVIGCGSLVQLNTLAKQCKKRCVRCCIDARSLRQVEVRRQCADMDSWLVQLWMQRIPW